MFNYRQQAITGNAATLTGATSSIGSSPTMVGGQGNFGSGGTWLGSTDFSFNILQDLINWEDQAILDKVYREIYSMDSVTGPAIDMLSLMPWSDYTLLGIDDDKILEIYQNSCDELELTRLLTSFTTVDYVLGRAIGTLVFDTSRGIFTDCIILNPTDAEITAIPLAGYDPKVDVKLDKDFLKFLRSSDKRDIEARKEIAPELLAQLLASGKVELEPLKTIYLSRSYMVGCENMSVLSRVLPIWMVEKALLRGTIISSARRQRSILQIQMGDDTYIPDEAQMGSVAQMFANADRDPLGAIVVTRPDVQTSEIRQGSDFWRVSEDQEMYTNTKLRALGLNESFLSGEATYSNAEAAITVFLKNLKTNRDRVTNAICRDKIFLNLAKYHNFRQRTETEIKSRIRYDVNSNKAKRNVALHKKALLTGSRNMAEVSQYIIPQVKWHEEFEPKGSTTEMQAIKDMVESGVPAPAAMIASAAGFNLQTIVDSYPKDIEMRKAIKKYQDDLAKVNPPPPEEEGEGGDFGLGASVTPYNKEPISTLPITNTEILSFIQKHLPENRRVTKAEVIALFQGVRSGNRPV
jgi:hypothetical protein